MGKYFPIILFLSILYLSKSATKVKVEDLFNGLYKGEVYSGYLQTAIKGNEYFYIYMPAQNKDPNAPIMLWLNGGPGCSSLFGLFGEVGPVTSNNFENEFKLNDFSWNKEVNLLAIEQPGGVGFSHSNDSKFDWTDDIMGENLLAGIKDFLKEFGLQGRDFYVSGESYAGVYIPFLVKYIYNDISENKVNLKGVLIGNGLTYFDTDNERSMVEFGFARGMISLETFKAFEEYCLHLPDELHPEKNINYNINNNKEFKDNLIPRNVTHKCNEIRKKIKNNLDGSDIYGIYRLCPKAEKIEANDPLYYNSQYTYKKTIMQKLKRKILNYNKNKNLKSDEEDEISIWPAGCGEDLFFDKFLNDEKIKSKLQVDSSIHWTQCAGINYELGESFNFYNETIIKHPDLRVWFFSGTDDGVLSTLGTMRWINKLNFHVEKPWTQYYVGKQVGGYAQKYKEGLVIVTVKGAGHMVPQDQREAAYKMYSSFIKGVLPFEE